jgi:endonuclease/exonuclease/phosphatase family metal-dependent hydrolase
LYWASQEVGPNDIVMICGDFNTRPETKTYKLMIKQGYTSSYREANGKEPHKTFPTGLQAPYMDRDPAATFDYIFYKG